MKFLPSDPIQRAIFLLLLIVFVASCIAPPYVEFLLMQHAPTVVAIVLLGYLSHRYPISRFSFGRIVAFLTLHTIGARYLYSYTPYDEWSKRLFGVSVSDWFGWKRNHYDRLVHFSYGLLMAIPVQEFERRHFKLSFGLASALAIEFIVATSAGYELTEWLVAVVFSPEWADQFLGQQGDIFDGQKDMALATLGAVLSIAGSVAVWRIRGRRLSEIE